MYRVWVVARYQQTFFHTGNGSTLEGPLREYRPDFIVYGKIRGIRFRDESEYRTFYLVHGIAGSIGEAESGVIAIAAPGSMTGPYRIGYKILEVYIDEIVRFDALPDVDGDPLPLLDSPAIYPGAMPQAPMHYPAMAPQPGLRPGMSPYPTPTPIGLPGLLPLPYPGTQPLPMVAPDREPIPSREIPEQRQPQSSPDSREAPGVSPPYLPPPVPPFNGGSPAPSLLPPECPPYCVTTMTICRYSPDPRINTILSKLDEVLAKLAEEEGLEIVSVEVPKFSHCGEEEPIFEMIQVPAIAGTENQVIRQFQAIARIEAGECHYPAQNVERTVLDSGLSSYEQRVFYVSLSAAIKSVILVITGELPASMTLYSTSSVGEAQGKFGNLALCIEAPGGTWAQHGDPAWAWTRRTYYEVPFCNLPDRAIRLSLQPNLNWVLLDSGER